MMMIIRNVHVCIRNVCVVFLTAFVNIKERGLL
jgi:hypothetical protein